jgi:CHAT domain-containing protein/tetratricopeptide (TPR) repeat protein
MWRSILVWTFLLALTVPVRSQQGALDDRTPANRPLSEVLQQAFAQYEAGQLDAARDAFTGALARATLADDTPAAADAHRGLGLVLSQKAEYPAARAELTIALTLATRASDRAGMAQTEMALFDVARLTGAWDEARASLARALAGFKAIGDRLGIARALLAETYDQALSIEDERERFKQAERIAIELGDKKLLARVLHGWGDHEFVRGDFSAAMLKLDRVIALLEELGDRRNLARALTSLGRLNRAHGHPEVSLTLYERALRAQREVGDQQGIIQTINASAVALEALGRQREATTSFERALQLARQTGSARIIDFQAGNLAGAYLNAKRYAKAADLLTEVLRQPPENALAAVRWGALGEAYLHLGRFEDGRRAFDRSIELQRAVGNPEDLLQVLDGRATLRRAMGEKQGALDDEQEALRLVEEVRARLVPTDFMKRGFATRHQQVYSNTIGLLHALGRDADALQTAEMARGRALVDLLAARGIADHEPGAASVRGVDSEGAAATVLARTRSQIASPESAPAPDLAEIADTARRLNSTFLLYYVTPDATFIFVVSPSSAVRCVRVSVAATRLEALIRRTRPEPRSAPHVANPLTLTQATATTRALQTRGGDVFVAGASDRQQWRDLHRLLIQPVLSSLPRQAGARLTIVPHGPLFLLSFAALRDARGRYLLEDYTLDYAPTAGVFRFTNAAARRALDRVPEYLLVADPTSMATLPNQRPLAALPGARREIAAIQRFLPSGSVTVLRGDTARERDVRERMRTATVVHLATHGIVRNDDPLDSFLALGRNGPNAEDDGRLTAAKVYDLDLHADLIVLSGCRTALGAISGDGIASLTRAFLSAGTASVIATLWDVADEPTYRLVPDFYRLRALGSQKAEALRAAQLRLLRALRAGEIKIGDVSLPEEPFLWAGFVLVGEP